MTKHEITIIVNHHYTNKSDVTELVVNTLRQCGWIANYALSNYPPKAKSQPKSKSESKAIHRMSLMNAPFPGYKAMVTEEEMWRLHNESIEMMIQKGINNYYPERYVRS